MVLAAVYSRAAYAYTGRRGLFDSVTQGAFLVPLACCISAMFMHGLLCPAEAISQTGKSFYTILVLNARWTGAMVFSLHRAAFDYAEHVDDASNELGPSCFMCAQWRSQGRSKEAAFLDMMCLAPEDLLCAQWRSLGPLQPLLHV